MLCEREIILLTDEQINQITEKVEFVKQYMRQNDISYEELNKQNDFQYIQWYRQKRGQVLSGAIDDNEILLYKKLNFNFGISLYTWNDWCTMLSDYLSKNNLDRVPQNAKINSLYSIGKWVYKQNINWDKLSDEQKELLTVTGLKTPDILFKEKIIPLKKKELEEKLRKQKIWEQKQEIWECKYKERLQKQEEELKIEERKLKIEEQKQKQEERKLLEKTKKENKNKKIIIKIEELKNKELYLVKELDKVHYKIIDLESCVDRTDSTLDKYIHALTFYRLTRGDFYVPWNYVTPNHIDLGRWFNTQKNLIKKGLLPNDIYRRLLEIGAVKTNISWDKGLKALKEYINEYKTQVINDNYVTRDGLRLGEWFKDVKLEAQKQFLTFEEISQLREAGCSYIYCSGFENIPLEKQWDNYYKLAEKYNNPIVIEDDKEYQVTLNWVKKQFAELKKLSENRTDKMYSIFEYYSKKTSLTLGRGNTHWHDKQITKRCMSSWEFAIIAIDIFPMAADSGTDILKEAEKADYFSCEIAINTLLSENQFKQYIETYNRNLVDYAKAKIANKYFKKVDVSTYTLKVDKIRYGLNTKIVSIMISVHLKANS